MPTKKTADGDATEAQKAQAEVSGVPLPSAAALKQAREDAEQRLADPHVAVVRDANPDFGGESFAYLDTVTG